MNKLFGDPTETMRSLIKNTSVNISDALDQHNKLMSALEDSYIGYKPVIYDTITTCEPYHHDIVYIHKTNCPNCGGLLDGDEHSPYVKCGCCGAKIWSEREVS